MIKQLFAAELILFFLALSGISCTSGSSTRGEIEPGPEKLYNLIITLYDKDIDNPENDRRSYYEIYINKAEAGRTNIALESQKKTFETKLGADRHLIKVEKWVLDDIQGRYIKLNNLYQPKPDFVYISIEKGKTTMVNVESTKFGTSQYTVTKE